MDQTMQDFHRLVKADGTVDSTAKYEDRKGLAQMPLASDIIVGLGGGVLNSVP